MGTALDRSRGVLPHRTRKRRNERSAVHSSRVYSPDRSSVCSRMKLRMISASNDSSAWVFWTARKSRTNGTYTCTEFSVSPLVLAQIILVVLKKGVGNRNIILRGWLL